VGEEGRGDRRGPGTTAVAGRWGGGTGEAAAAGDEGRQAAGGEGGRLGEQFCRSDCWNRGRRSDGFLLRAVLSCVIQHFWL
jgi:hypothetical protein